MPMRFGRAFVLAVAGGIATSICWWLLLIFLWLPYWQQINRAGMYVHDVEAVYLITFGPIVVVPLFLMTILLTALFEKRRFELGRPPPGNAWRVLLFGALPGLVTVLLMNGLRPDSWRFPLSETSVFLVGLLLGLIWVRWRREDEPAAVSPTQATA